MKRLLAILLALVLVCAFFFVAFEAEHDCTGENCRICCQISTCLRTLGQLLLIAAAVCAAALLMTRLAVCRTGAVCVACTTLIRQKVKLSD